MHHRFLPTGTFQSQCVYGGLTELFRQWMMVSVVALHALAQIVGENNAFFVSFCLVLGNKV